MSIFFDTYIDNYLWGVTLPNIDTKKLADECKFVERYALEKFSQTEDKISSENFTTNKFYLYNTFWFPLEELQKLFYSIREVILPSLPNEPHVIQSWVNFFYKNKNIDWHMHWESRFRAIHGFFCVDTEAEESFTEYRVEHLSLESVKVKSKDGYLVFGKSDGDVHRSSLWHKEVPRITIAFDIVPVSTINNYLVKDNIPININFIPFI